jgi:ribonuclease HII
MTVFDALYEGYGLARNKGYGTEEHFRALREKGPTGLHRASFRLG